MKSVLIVVVLAHSLLIACSQFETKNNRNHEYLMYRSEFEVKCINHFPMSIQSDSSWVISNMDTSKHNVRFSLYEFNVNIQRIDSISEKLHLNSIAQYNAYDSCLIIVNRFENFNSYNNFELASISDSSLINRPCYDKKYPIPNFLEYSMSNDEVIRLDSSFTIYVIEAKAEVPSKKYNQLPFTHMPSLWRNGYSKGIAISRSKQIIIFWVVIW